MSETGGGLGKKIGLGCLGLIALSALGFGGLTLQAHSALEARKVDVAARIADARAAAAEPRPSVLGAETVDGNAATWYWGLIWAWGADLPDRLETSPPPLPPGAADDRAAERPAWDVGLQEELRGEVQGGDAASPQALAQAEAYRPLLRYAREGLRRSRCDWGYEWERGYASAIPDLLALRGAAILMAHEASTAEDPREGLRIGEALLAFSDDLFRHPALIGGVIAAGVRELAVDCLARLLARRALPAADCERLLAALARCSRPGLGSYLDGELMAARTQVLATSGHPVDASYGAEAALEDTGRESGGLWYSTWFLERELRGMEDYLGKRVRAYGELPYTERVAAAPKLEKEISKAPFVLVRIATPNVSQAANTLDADRARVALLRIVVAAQLYRLEHGALPDGLEPLKARLGGELPLDPFADGEPPRLRRDGERLRVYSIGENQQDDDGTPPAEGAGRESGDLVLETRAPAE